MLIVLTGFFASVAHVVTGPDHLAAVTPFSLDFRKKAWVVGFSWGIGHTCGMLVIGFIFILFREIIPIDAISRNSEKLVGLMLILIGVWSILRQIMLGKSFMHKYTHTHPHIHQNNPPELHIHKHVHEESHTHEHSHVKSYRQPVLTALTIGIIHGLAGFSHLLAVLPSLALPSRMDSVLYLASFGSGTIITMILYTFMLGILATKLEGDHRHELLFWISILGGLLAIGIGFFWLFMRYPS
ncbi:MAG: sulfite exporter TauE/SafE family protein [Bacteroidales bacterium]|jgi:ABC-type nickel/cobalt efflux system permease component RcnA|nr:sulfite exporter TauE/SafE family protein [Bacteroidales bacterium]